MLMWLMLTIRPRSTLHIAVFLLFCDITHWPPAALRLLHLPSTAFVALKFSSPVQGLSSHTGRWRAKFANEINKYCAVIILLNLETFDKITKYRFISWRRTTQYCDVLSYEINIKIKYHFIIVCTLPKMLPFSVDQWVRTFTRNLSVMHSNPAWAFIISIFQEIF